jgi:hypothetical protein
LGLSNRRAVGHAQDGENEGLLVRELHFDQRSDGPEIGVVI